MPGSIFKRLSYESWLYTFILIHLLCWTLIPALVRYNLPLDAIEGTIWGHQLQWGYDKNPFLNGWLTALAVQFSPVSGWGIYLFSQLSVSLCFLAVMQLGKQLFTPAQTLCAVFVLEGMQYFNLHAIDFNDNTLELGLWAWTVYLFYQSLRKPRLLTWIATGLVAALGMMTKYYTAVLLLALALFLLTHAQSRAQLKTWRPYIGLLCFLGLMLPHGIWLYYHDYITITYVFERTKNIPHWTNHLFFPLQFTWQQLQVLLPALLLYAVLLLGKKPLLAESRPSLTSFNRDFLFFAALGPLLITLCLSLIFGITLRAGWGMPLLSFWGLLFILACPPALTPAKIHRFIAATFIFMGTLLTAYVCSLVYSSDTSSANFPGRRFAEAMTQEWHHRYHTPLNYVAGSRWLGGNLGFYSSDHPAVFVEWNKQRAPWIKLHDFEQKGGIFVWEIDRHEVLPAEVKQHFPRLSSAEIWTFTWRRDWHHLPPAQIGVAFLPPSDDRHP